MKGSSGVMAAAVLAALFLSVGCGASSSNSGGTVSAGGTGATSSTISASSTASTSSGSVTSGSSSSATTSSAASSGASSSSAGGGSTTSSSTTSSSTTSSSTTSGSSTGSTSTSAATTGTSSTGGSATFDGSRAFTMLQAQCNFGPRPMGSDAHNQCLNWIVQQLTPLVDAAPIQQTFSYTSPGSGQTFNVTNVIGRINPTAQTQVMLAAHWDTRPVADQDTNLANRTKPILGADDGASEVAVLLELARVFHANRPSVGVEFVFFDGEDYAPSPGSYNEMYLGSTYFASHLTDANGKSLRPTYGILLDMIGDQELNIYEEKNSLDKAQAIVSKVWGAAAALGYSSSFIPQLRYTVEDDHLPLLQKNIPVIDCIDFDYEVQVGGDPSRQYWHTLMDTPDKCSAQSLQIVGNVMSKVIYGES